MTADPVSEVPAPETAAAVPADEAAPPPSGQSPREAELEAELAAFKDKALRALAEAENTRRRLSADKEEALRYAAAAFAREVVPVADNLRRALDSIGAEARAKDKALDNLAVGVEMVERMLLAAFERVLFECARPRSVVLTTPNVEYNVRLEGLPAGRLRHRDHRFEWTRAEFEAWARRVAATHGYTVRFQPIGPEDPAVGAPTQMGVFRLGSP